MRHFYKDPDLYPQAGSVYEYDSQEARDQYGPARLLSMTSIEVNAHLSPATSYQKELAALNAVYQADVEKFNKAFAIAYLADGPEQDAKQAVIRSQYEARKTLHAANVVALKSQYGIGV